MRILLMCEGTNEETLISALLDANAFKFTKDDFASLYFVRATLIIYKINPIGIHNNEYPTLSLKYGSIISHPTPFKLRIFRGTDTCASGEISLIKVTTPYGII